jgi:hypothetical protein
MFAIKVVLKALKGIEKVHKLALMGHLPQTPTLTTPAPIMINKNTLDC